MSNCTRKYTYHEILRNNETVAKYLKIMQLYLKKDILQKEYKF